MPKVNWSWIILEYDYEIVEAILYLRDAKECVTRQKVRNIALGKISKEKIGDVNASDGWLLKDSLEEIGYHPNEL